ncbi:MAG: DUF2281 domain-containing protein [Deltaproteobacteria bacterium]|nr:DUF2281 domain-containing protein [Deltaproteobacteria bacterium]
MNDTEKILRDFEDLPPEGQREVIDFLAFLKSRYGATKKSGRSRSFQLRTERFVGLWADREDLRDSSSWVRELRRREWGR